jgi:hypothetical protein
VNIASIADTETLENRICDLVNKPYAPPGVSLRNLFVTLVSFIIIIGAFIMPVHAREFHPKGEALIVFCAEKECPNSCANKVNQSNDYSQSEKNVKIQESFESIQYSPVK